MVFSKLIAPSGQSLFNEAVLAGLHEGLDGHFAGQKILILIPDHTRSLPLPLLYRSIVDVLQAASQLDFMVALGTHPPLNDRGLYQLVGITPEERSTTYQHVGLLQHVWNDPAA